MNWKIIPRDEQQTEIIIDYQTRKILFFTNRKQVAKRIEKRAGKPDDIEMVNGMIVGVQYTRDLTNDNIKPFLSMGTLIGSFRYD